MAEDSALVMHRSWFDPNCGLCSLKCTYSSVGKIRPWYGRACSSILHKCSKWRVAREVYWGSLESCGRVRGPWVRIPHPPQFSRYGAMVGAGGLYPQVGGSSPSIGTNSDVDEWFSHHADTVGALHNVGSNPTVTTNGEYTLRLIPGRKVNWLHVGSIPSSPTNI